MFATATTKYPEHEQMVTDTITLLRQAKDLEVIRLILHGLCRAAAEFPRKEPRAATRVTSELKALRTYVHVEREFNAGWIALHIRDGHPAAAERRKEVVAERDKWLCALDEVIGSD